ncbi:hypothetical protein, partial [Paraburkholderia tuberum]|uniref:hypothetical protein n=1 Tax=Paraburkholderia tuberum TaxID=157910 RepID=UPI001590F948
VAVAGSADEWSNDVAVAIAQGHHLVALQMLVPAILEIVATFLRRRRGAVAVDDRKVKQLVLMKLLHRARKDGIDATIGLPATKRAVDARIGIPVTSMQITTAT